MDKENFTPSEPVRGSKIYSAPRRFDLATLFVVMIVYACLLGLFVGIGMPDAITFAILIFISAVAISQPVLFGGKMPRLASLLVGGVSLPIIIVLLTLIYAPDFNIRAMIGGAICCSPLGLSFGYLAGALVGGVFLVADLVRNGRGVEF